MKVLFVWPNVTTVDEPRPHLGLASLSAVLKQAGHDVALLTFETKPARKEVLESIRAVAPELVAYSSMTNQWRHVARVAPWVREATDAPSVAGGNHPTLAPEECLDTEGIDMVCRGEGEETLLELAGALERGEPVDRIPNLWLKHAGKLIRNPVRRLQGELDSLPDTDFELFDLPRILEGSGGEVMLMAGRGCPYECDYCCSRSFKALYQGKGRFTRRRSPQRFLTELHRMLESYPGIRLLHFIDEVFLLSQRWLEEFGARYEREIALPFICYARPELLDRRRAERLRQMGCCRINIGVESGSEWLRHHLLNRRMTDRQLRDSFRLAHELGLDTLAYAMVGIPYETPEMVQQTIDLLVELEPTRFSAAIFHPFPGTRLERLCRRNGWITDRVVGDPYSESILDLPTMSAGEIKEWFHRMTETMYQVGVKKEPLGRIDLLALFEEALVSGEGPRRAFVSDFTYGYLPTYWLWVAPGIRVTYEVELPEEPELVFDIGLDRGAFRENGRLPVEFRVEVDGEVLFQRVLRPEELPRDRYWEPARVELGALRAAGARRRIVLTALYELAQPAPYAAGWGRPRIVSKGGVRTAGERGA